MIALIVAAFMLYGPYLWCYIRKEPIEGYGLRWTLSKRSITEASICLAATLLPLTLIALHWPGGGLPRSMSYSSILPLMAAGSVAAVVEEVFFRGWIQTLTTKAWNPVVSILITSLLFSLAHLFIKVHWLRLATFFPGLIMGVLRYRHRSVAPSALYHLVGNIWSIWFFPDML